MGSPGRPVTVAGIAGEGLCTTWTRFGLVALAMMRRFGSSRASMPLVTDTGKPRKPGLAVSLLRLPQECLTSRVLKACGAAVVQS